jgi:spermidine/putrescine transport system ATP-binding protein
VDNTELLRLEGIKKSFGNVEVLRGLDLSAAKGEFITLLGSSGCGKTTTIRIIAGLETADTGKVFIDGRDVSSLEPDKRGVNMVFQNYALFPHMNVEQNTGYSLKLKGLPKAEIKEKVGKALELVQLSGFERRKPEELSGGQRQRVAVARAVINEPKVLLLDEPLGALDLQLRRQMQIELKKLQKQLGITFIYITHDQEEALTMSDRIAVMRNGVFEQIGCASEIYNRPKTGFVAKFVGSANVIKGRVAQLAENSDGANADHFYFEHPSGRAEVMLTEPPDTSCSESEKDERGCSKGAKPSFATGDEITIAVREENVTLNRTGSRGLAAVVTGKSFAGGLLRITAALKNAGNGVPAEEINASQQGINSSLEIGDEVFADWLPADAVPVDTQ